MSISLTGSHLSLRKIVAVTLIVIITVLLVPVPAAATILQSSEQRVSDAGNQAWTWLASGIGPLWSNPGATDRQRNGVRPAAAMSKLERESSVASLEVNPAERVVLQSRQKLIFSAIPLDA